MGRLLTITKIGSLKNYQHFYLHPGKWQGKERVRLFKQDKFDKELYNNNNCPADLEKESNQYQASVEEHAKETLEWKEKDRKLEAECNALEEGKHKLKENNGKLEGDNSKLGEDYEQLRNYIEETWKREINERRLLNEPTKKTLPETKGMVIEAETQVESSIETINRLQTKAESVKNCFKQVEFLDFTNGKQVETWLLKLYDHLDLTDGEKLQLKKKIPDIQKQMQKIKARPVWPGVISGLILTTLGFCL